MLSPFQIEKMSQSLQDIYQEIESDLLKNIASRFSLLDEVTPNTVSAWQLEKLNELGGLNQDNIKLIEQYSKKTKSEIAKIFAEAGYKCLEYDESIYKKALEKGLLKTAASPLKASSSIQQIISSAIGHAKQSFNLVNTTALQSASQSFMDIINRTYLETSLGVRSYNDSIRTAVRELADKGITGITYRRNNGQIINYPVDAAVRRNIITSTSQTAGELQLKRAEEWGSNLVEVSSHMGARPSHAVWQGKIFYRKGHPVEGYKEFESTTGYGTAEGLKGINCSHDFYPFFEGLSEQTYFPYDDDENAKAYEESQRQRKLERDIRQQKRRILAAEEISDEEGKLLAQIKLKDKEAELKSFLGGTGRTQRANRQQVMGFGRSQASEAAWADKQLKAPEQYAGKSFKRILNADKAIDGNYKKILESRFATGSENARKAFAKYVKPGSVADGNFVSGVAHYNPGSKKIKMNYAADSANPRGVGATYFHEHGHMVDAHGSGLVSNKKEYYLALQKDCNDYIINYAKQGGMSLFNAQKAISSDLYADELSSVSDLMNALSNNAIKGKWGHDPRYWVNSEKLTAEAFAHMFEAQFNNKRLGAMKKYFPEALKEFEMILEGLL